jgi:hypothetical protein
MPWEYASSGPEEHRVSKEIFPEHITEVKTSHSLLSINIHKTNGEHHKVKVPLCLKPPYTASQQHSIDRRIQ